LADWLEQRARELKMSGVSERDVPRVLQVKEKFGTLRFCARVPDILLNHWRREVEAAEERSAEVCERCGAPGQLLREGWRRTRCEKCEIEGWKS
jgi:ribosomal protein L40E